MYDLRVLSYTPYHWGHLNILTNCTRYATMNRNLYLSQHLQFKCLFVLSVCQSVYLSVLMSFQVFFIIIITIVLYFIYLCTDIISTKSCAKKYTQLTLCKYVY